MNEEKIERWLSPQERQPHHFEISKINWKSFAINLNCHSHRVEQWFSLSIELLYFQLENWHMTFKAFRLYIFIKTQTLLNSAMKISRTQIFEEIIREIGRW